MMNTKISKIECFEDNLDLVGLINNNNRLLEVSKNYGL